MAFFEEEDPENRLIMLKGEAGCGKTSFLQKIIDDVQENGNVIYYSPETNHDLIPKTVCIVKDATADLDSGLSFLSNSNSIFVLIGANYGIVGGQLEEEARSLEIQPESIDYGRKVAENLSSERKFIELTKTTMQTAFRCNECTNRNTCERRKILTSFHDLLGRRHYRYFIYWYLTERPTRLLSPSLIIEWIIDMCSTFYTHSRLQQSVRLNWKGKLVEDVYLHESNFDLKLIGDPAFNEFITIFNDLDSSNFIQLPNELKNTLQNAINHFIRKESQLHISPSMIKNDYYLGSILDDLNSNLSTDKHIFLKQKWNLSARKNYENYLIEIKFDLRGVDKNPIIRLDYRLYRIIHRLSLGDIQVNQDVDYLRSFLLECFDLYAEQIGFENSQHLLISLGLMQPADLDVYNRLLVSYRSKKDEFKINRISSLRPQLFESEVSYEDIDFYSPGLPRDGHVSLKLKTFPFKDELTPSPAIDHPHTPITKSIRPDRARLREFCIGAYGMLGHNVRKPVTNRIQNIIDNVISGKKNPIIPFPWDWESNVSPYYLGIILGWARLFSEYKIAESEGKGWGMRLVTIPRKVSDLPWFRSSIVSKPTQRGYIGFLEDIGVIESASNDQMTLSLSLLKSIIIVNGIDQTILSLDAFVNDLKERFCIILDSDYSRNDLIRRLSMLGNLQRGSDYDDTVILRRNDE